MSVEDMHTMVVTTKLWGLGWAVYDGSIKDEKLRPMQVELKVKEVPSLLPFLSYCFFGSGCISGPFLEYRHFVDFIERKGIYEKMPSGVTGALSSVMPSVYRILLAWLFTACYLGTEIIGLDAEFTGSKEFITHRTLLWRIGYMIIVALYHRFLFYVNWCLIDASMISCGINYNGKDEDGNDKWDRFLGVYILRCELATSGVDYMHNWNISTQEWLLRYVHIRWAEPGQKQGFGDAMKTAIVSSVWHGWYVAYPSAFIQTAIITECSREFYRAREAFAWMNPTIRAFLAWFATLLAFSYIGCGFRILEA